MRAAPIVLAVAVGTVSGGPEGIARRSSDTGSLVVVVRERGSGRPSLTGVVGAMRINPYRQKGWVLAAVRLEDGSDVLARMIDCDPGATYDNVRVIFTEDVAEVVGRVPAGAPPSTLLYGLLFPEDEHLWYPGSSWIREEMLGSESQVVLGDVPVGAAYYALLLDYEGGLCDDRMSPRG